jgi:hypothetical protein
MRSNTSAACALLSAILLMAPGAVIAVPAYGLGGQGCGDYIAKRRKPDAHFDIAMANWLAGYVTGYNAWGDGHEIDAGGRLDTNAMLAYLDKWCGANPLKSTTGGVTQLIREISGRR